MKILFAGESPGHSANYLMGVLKSGLKAQVTHVPSTEKLTPTIAQKKWDGIIFSDFLKKNLPFTSEKYLAKQIQQGTGFLMVGGWASFSGPFGGWEKSSLAQFLPVDCLKKDDRTNFPGGALIFKKQDHPILKGLSFKKVPAICGLNLVKPKKESSILLGTHQVIQKNVSAGQLALEKKEYPLLVIHNQMRTVAFTSDFAPHWCGGLVDWGKYTKPLTAFPKVQIQVGSSYIQLVSSLTQWITGK